MPRPSGSDSKGAEYTMGKKILLINDRLHAGGAELVLQNLAFALAERGDELTVWAPEGDRETLRRKYPVGLRYARLPFWDKPCRRWSPKWFFCRACRALFGGFILKLKKWDVVIAMKEGPSMRLASKLRAERKLAWVHTDFNSLHWTRYDFHSDAEERECMERFDKVVCVSEAGADGIRSTVGDPGNLCVRYNPLDVRAIVSSAALVPKDCRRPNGKPLFVAVGRLTPVKRYAMLMDICKRLEAEFDFELWIVGGGELEDELREKLRRDEISSVRLLGARDNPYPYMLCADWFVSSSESECHPIAIQEALVLGVPVIASYCPAVEETLDPAFGIITGTDGDALEAGMRRILTRPELSAEYKARIARDYDSAALWQPRIDAILELME